jgi:hypothetical protein
MTQGRRPTKPPPRSEPATEPAAAAYASLPLREKRRLVYQLVLSRAEELLRSHPEIRWVSFGHRMRTARRRRDLTIDPEEPCLVFLVDRKLPRSRVKAGNVLPSSLTISWNIDGREVPISIPTDVQETGLYRGAVPHGAPVQIAAVSGDDGPELGQVCCAIRSQGTTFTLGCLHVFSPKGARSGAQDATLFLADEDDSQLGETTTFAGTIRPATADGNLSFDAQFALVEDNAALHAALGDAVLIGSIAQPPDIPSTYFAQTSHGPVEVTQNKLAGPEVEIIYDRDTITGAGGFPVRHAELLVSKFSADSPLVPGDSGSPLTTERDGGLLIGMHIAGDSDRSFAYALPAWRILGPANYEKAPDLPWELVKQIELPPPHLVGPPLGSTPGLADREPPAVDLNNLESKRAFARFAKAAADQLVQAGFKINPTVCACQAILESNWGTSRLTKEHNAFFGIKAQGNFTGSRAHFATTEFDSGGPTRIEDDFRSYPSWRESFRDYGKLIGEAKRYANAQANSGDALRCLQEIKAAGYATDPNYVGEVQGVSRMFPHELGTIG